MRIRKLVDAGERIISSYYVAGILGGSTLTLFGTLMVTGYPKQS